MDLGLRCRKSFHLCLGSENVYCAVRHSSDDPPGLNKSLVIQHFPSSVSQVLEIFVHYWQVPNTIGVVSVFCAIKRGADAPTDCAAGETLFQELRKEWSRGAEKQQLPA